jgi:hypothetical protein
MSGCTSIENISINAGSLCVYTEFVERSIATGHEFRGERKPGVVSKSAQAKIIKAVGNLCWLSGAKKLTKNRKFLYNPNKLTFATLTIPGKQKHSDNEIKRECLNQLFVELRRDKQIKNYIWRAEKTISGNLHFHIIFDKFIHYTYLREHWNRVINKFGYVSDYSDKMSKLSFDEYYDTYSLDKYKNNRRTKSQCYTAYLKGKSENWTNPNSVDIHSIKKARSIEGYISKYISKTVYTPFDGEFISENVLLNDGDKNIQGNVWYCSKSLQFKVNGIYIDERISNLLKKVQNIFTQKVKLVNNYSTVIKVSLEDLFKYKIYDFFDIYKKQLNNYKLCAV